MCGVFNSFSKKNIKRMNLAEERVEHIIMSIMGFFIFLLYTIIIFVLLSSSRLREKKSNQLLLNLSIGHLMTGLSHFAGLWTTFRVGKLIFVSIIYANISLTMLIVDRCIYILRPLRYQLLHRGWHVLFMSISPAFASALLAQYCYLGFNDPIHKDSLTTYPFIFFVFVITGLMFIPSVVVFRIAHKQRSRIAPLRRPHVVHNLTPGVATKDVSRIVEIRSFYVCFGCVTTYLVLWSPALGMRLWEIVLGLEMQYTYLAISVAIATLNPFSDAFICVWFNKELKKKLRSIVRKSYV